MRWVIYERAKAEFSNVRLTYGYATKHTRIECGLKKSHSVDARCISGNPLAKPCRCLLMRQRRRHNRQIFKAKTLKGGLRKRNQAPYLVNGFRLFDKVYFNGEECFIFGRRARGSFNIRKFNGEKVNAGISYKKLKFKGISRRYLITFKEKECRVSSHD